MKFIRLLSTEIDKNLVKFNFETSPDISKYFTSKCLWIEYKHDVSDIPLSILNCSFVGVVQGCAWLLGAKIFLYSIDEGFYRCLSRLKEAYLQLYPQSHLFGNVVAGEIIENRLEKNDTNSKLLLYSGGADCLTTFIRHNDSNLLLFNIYGWKVNPSEKSNVEEADFRDCKSFADRHGKNFYSASSNFAKLFTPELDKECKSQTNKGFWFGFLHSMAFISISIPIAYQKAIKNILIASSYHYKTEQVCASHSTTDNEFRYGDTGKVVYDGATLTRQDKIRVISEYQKSINKPVFLRVCSFNDHNCLTCEKCFRTIAGIIAENNDPRNFGFHFTEPILDFYKKYFSNSKNMAYWGVFSESYHYKFARERMRENYDKIENKDFVDWFLNFDFVKEKKTAMRKYYRQNFFSILKRKLFSK